MLAFLFKKKKKAEKKIEQTMPLTIASDNKIVYKIKKKKDI